MMGSCKPYQQGTLELCRSVVSRLLFNMYIVRGRSRGDRWCLHLSLHHIPTTVQSASPHWEWTQQNLDEQLPTLREVFS